MDVYSVDAIQITLLFHGIQKSWIVQSLLYRVVHVAHHHVQTPTATSLVVLVLQQKLSSQVVHLILLHRLQKLVL